MADAKLSVLPVGTVITDADLFYSAQAGTSVRQTASAFRSYVASGARTQRAVVAAIIVQSTDQIINCNIATATSVSLPLASTRVGQPLTFKDIGGQFSASPLTINRTAPDTIQSLTSIVLSNNYAAVTLWPCNDGVNSGWFVL